MLVMWMADRLLEKGLGNGSSVIIFVGIISEYQQKSLWELLMMRIEGSLALWAAILIAVVMLITITAVTYMKMKQSRKIPVQYAKRVVGRKLYGGENSHIPMKVNQSGVMPNNICSSLLAFPQTIAMFMEESAQTFVSTYLIVLRSSDIGFSIYRKYSRSSI